MKRKLRTIMMSMAIASVAVVGSIGLAGQASAYNDFNGFPTLRQGDSGGYVRALQANLWAFGYQSTVGSVDGSFGSNVTTGLRAYQSKFGLSSDGVAGSGTWSSMSNYVVTESTNHLFYLSTPFSSTYWVYYTHPGGSTSSLTYDLMYKSNNATVSTGRVY